MLVLTEDILNSLLPFLCSLLQDLTASPIIKMINLGLIFATHKINMVDHKFLNGNYLRFK